MIFLKRRRRPSARTQSRWRIIGGSGGDRAASRGAGSDIRGLCAMRWRRGSSFVRCWTRSRRALRAYLRRIGQPWREDPKPTPARITRETGFAVRRCLRWRRLIQTRRALARLAASAQRDEDYLPSNDELGLGVPLKLVNGACLPRKARGAASGAGRSGVGRLIERTARRRRARRRSRSCWTVCRGGAR